MATNYLRYNNQGATRSQPLSQDLIRRLSYLGDLGITAEVFSGGQPGQDEGGARVGSTRHDHGNAADVFFYKDGRKLDWANPSDLPIFNDIVSKGRTAGITGFGAGPGYMQEGSLHIGMGTPGVWGAGGKGDNAPSWLRSAFNGSTADPIGDVVAAGPSQKPNVGYVAFGSIGPTNTSDRPETAPIAPQPTAIPGAVIAQSQGQVENKPSKLNNLFGLLAQVGQQEQAEPAQTPIQGPSQQQAQALNQVLQSLRNRLI